MRWSPHLEVSYCTNVHPGEGYSAFLNTLQGPVLEVKSAFHPEHPFGGGFRLGAQSVRDFMQPTQQDYLINLLQEHDLYVFSVNGFPYGDFAAPSIKQKVYDPDWSQYDRLAYTLDLARLMTNLPGPSIRTISTVAGGFQPTPPSQDRLDQFQKHFSQLAEGLYQLEQETGISVRIALEPEPWTTLERVDQVIPFFENVVWPASPHAKTFIGLCYDTCHQALAFEDPRSSWQMLVNAGVPIYKVQISNALRLVDPSSEVGRAALLSYHEPRYLHQLTALTSHDQVLRSLDLGDQDLLSRTWLEASEWRCHFHVPIWWQGQREQTLQTTRFFWEAIAEIIRHPNAQPHTSAEFPLHVEVETYSWGVLPVALRSERTLVEDVILELKTLKPLLTRT